jgi:hypothetical protein
MPDLLQRGTAATYWPEHARNRKIAQQTEQAITGATQLQRMVIILQRSVARTRQYMTIRNNP